VSNTRETLYQRALRFARALVVGSGATLCDFSVFTLCVRAAGIAPTSARIPALIVGASFQFFGNRSFTFRAQAGSLSRQAKWFIVFEAITLLLNWSVFKLLLGTLERLPAEIVSFMGTFVVFVTFAYPMRKLVVFKLPP
jgi:putative flippase GtrA